MIFQTNAMCLSNRYITSSPQTSSPTLSPSGIKVDSASALESPNKYERPEIPISLSYSCLLLLLAFAPFLFSLLSHFFSSPLFLYLCPFYFFSLSLSSLLLSPYSPSPSHLLPFSSFPHPRPFLLLPPSPVPFVHFSLPSLDTNLHQHVRVHPEYIPASEHSPSRWGGQMPCDKGLHAITADAEYRVFVQVSAI